MKFLVDAQLPHRLALELSQAGHEAIPTLDLPQGNRASDEEIMSKAAQESRILITKDSDFATMFLLRRMPPKLLLISTGNISNDCFFGLLRANLTRLESVLTQNDFVELSPSAITIHG